MITSGQGPKISSADPFAVSSTAKLAKRLHSAQDAILALLVLSVSLLWLTVHPGAIFQSGLSPKAFPTSGESLGPWRGPELSNGPDSSCCVE